MKAAEAAENIRKNARVGMLSANEATENARQNVARTGISAAELVKALRNKPDSR